MSRRTLFLVSCILLIGVGIVACARPPQPPDSTPSPLSVLTATPDGATLLQERCSVCHSLERVQQARKTSSEWEQTVTRMVGRGAKLNEEERTLLIAYLAKQYGP